MITVACSAEPSSAGPDPSPTSLGPPSLFTPARTISTSTTQAVAISVPSSAPTTTAPSVSPSTGAPPATQFTLGPLHRWLQRNWEFGQLVATRDAIRSSIDNDQASSSLDALEHCADLASTLAARSADDSVLTDQVQVFDGISSACASMAAATVSNDDDALRAGRALLESGYTSVSDLFSAFEELLFHGDSNEADFDELVDMTETP